MGSFRLSAGLLGFMVMLASVQAGRNFWLFRQRVLQQWEERAAKEVYYRLRLLAQGPTKMVWTPPKEGTILQPLDHFDRQERRTFNQRFWINEDYWQRPSGPVFLYIGGEGALSEYAVQSGHYVEMARKYGALVVALEHRFYGASLNPDGLEDHNLQFLSSQQALADLVSFHRFVTQKYALKSNTTWICFGGSYPGSLAAWFRLKFPHLVFAAVASSAPVRAQLDFLGYNEVVAASLSNPVVGGSKECLEAVAEAFFVVDSLMQAGEQAKLAKDFCSCGPLGGPDDCVEMVSNLADIFMGIVQYNNEGVSWGTVASVCRIMTNHSGGSPYQRLMAVTNMYLNNMGLPCLHNSHNETLQILRSTNITMWGVGMRQWYFQTCTEFGYYQTCEEPACPFSRLMTLKPQLDLCWQVFNISPDSVQEAVSFTNEYYGADHPKASRVLFVNGDIDPWHALSVLKNQSLSEVAILINGTAHCANMSPSQPFDPLPLVEARQRITSQVGIWLKRARKMDGDC
ncbi:thymus-specific serine protease [Hemicordylus capensis]|uniref:thymus-specific serine protease n=1 Tax=Hemicordylus capensis TaxID=884348 RepID=UPI002303B6A4|nr:thymus-specific serine protease [Hemicordylus capensis]